MDLCNYTKAPLTAQKTQKEMLRVRQPNELSRCKMSQSDRTEARSDQA